MRSAHPAAPVCVLGMHRSGTSLTARLLNLLSVDLGPEETMLDPIPTDNARGFWEQSEIRSLNDEILEHLGGTWWRLPELPLRWEASPQLEPLKARARRLVDELFGGEGPWGLKDPRMSVTLPLWREVAPDLRYVLCVRNPLDVTASLEKRDRTRHGDRALNGDLWLAYTANALIHTAGCSRLIVLYDDLLDDTDRGLRRLAAFLHDGDDSVDAEAYRAVAGFVEGGLRHHASRTDPIDDADTPPEAGLLYMLVRGSAWSSVNAVGERPPLAGETLDHLARRLLHTRAAGARLARETVELREKVQAVEEAAREALSRLEALELERTRLLAAQRDSERRARQLREIEASASWRVTRPLRAAKGLFASERGS